MSSRTRLTDTAFLLLPFQEIKALINTFKEALTAGAKIERPLLSMALLENNEALLTTVVVRCALQGLKVPKMFWWWALGVVGVAVVFTHSKTFSDLGARVAIDLRIQIRCGRPLVETTVQTTFPPLLVAYCRVTRTNSLVRNVGHLDYVKANKRLI